MGEIPTISDWAKKQDWYREKTKNIYEDEKARILKALKKKPVKQVAYEFGRSKEAIYNIIRKGKNHA